jgi:tRNA-specific 2-thiouridylase
VPKVGEKIDIRVRYRQALTSATIKSINGDRAIIVPEKEVDAVTPGQSLVMYMGEECLGGGIIQ